MEEGLKRTDFFVRQILGKYVFSSVLSMLATSIAGMIDTVFVGRFLGETGLSAMSLVNPVYLIYYTLGAVIGMGGATAATLRIGKGDYEGYRRLFSLATAVIAVLSILVTAGGMLFLKEMVVFLGGEGIVGEYMLEYLRWYILLGGFTLLVYIPLYFLRTEGKPQISSYLFLLSSGLNVVLSWLFMSPVCHMGMKGASIATGLSMAVTAVVGFYVLLKDSRELRPVKFQFKEIGQILLTGSPNGCNNLFNALRLFALNSMIIGIGAGVCLSAFAVVKSVSDLLTGIITGVSSALMPIVGVFYGERDRDSIRRVCKTALKIGLIINIVMVIAVGGFPKIWCVLFNVTDTFAIEGAGSGLFCLALSFLAAFFNLMLIGYFNTIKKPLLSNLILGLRLLIYLVPAAAALGKGFGIAGIWGALIAADFLTLFTIVLVIYVIRKRNPALDIFLLDKKEVGRGEISFSVKNKIEDIMYASTRITDFCEKQEMDIKKTMHVSLALEEMLTVIITYCMDNSKEQFIDIRIVDLGEDILLRIRNAGKIFDPVRFYEENKENEEMMEQVLGIKMMVNSAKTITFHETFGTNNLMLIF